MRLSWNDDLRTGIREIDLQHQVLIEIINALEDLYLNGHKGAVLQDAIKRLSSYALFHFATEESMLRTHTIDVGHALKHEQEHVGFVKSLNDFSILPAALQMNSLDRLIEFLKHWLITHVMKTDKDLAQLILGHPGAPGGSRIRSR